VASKKSPVAGLRPGKLIQRPANITDDEFVLYQMQAVLDWHPEDSTAAEPIIADPQAVGQAMLAKAMAEAQASQRACSKCVWLRDDGFNSAQCGHPVVARPTFNPATGQYDQTPREVYKVRRAGGQCGVEGRMFDDAEKMERQLEADMPVAKRLDLRVRRKLGNLLSAAQGGSYEFVAPIILILCMVYCIVRLFL
jgi:hypothetical protein